MGRERRETISSVNMTDPANNLKNPVPPIAGILGGTRVTSADSQLALCEPDLLPRFRVLPIEQFPDPVVERRA